MEYYKANSANTELISAEKLKNDLLSLQVALSGLTRASKSPSLEYASPELHQTICKAVEDINVSISEQKPISVLGLRRFDS